MSLKSRFENFIGGQWAPLVEGKYEYMGDVSPAEVLENNLNMLAVAESWENGTPVRETLAAEIPLVVEHFRYFVGATRSLE